MSLRWMNARNFSNVIALCSLLVLAIPVGIANMYLGYVMGESPCTLCWNERIGMVTFGVLALFMAVYGPKLKYIGAMMICAAYGLWMTARHTSLDGWSWDVAMGFGTAIFGAHTYTWGVVVYWAVVLVMGLVILMMGRDAQLLDMLGEKTDRPMPMTPFVRIVFILSMIVTASNGVQAFFQNGIPPFSGKGEPERFTMDLSTAPERWTTGVWKRLLKPISLTGRNTVDTPYIVGASTPKLFKFNENAADGAVANLKPALTLTKSYELPFAATGFMGGGNAAGISWNPEKKMYAVVTTEAGIYFTDESLKVTHRAVLDKMNGYDIRYTADTAWVGGMVINTGDNKTLWAVEPADKVDDFKDWNTFRESTKNLKTSWYRDRPVVTTVRAKKAHVATIAASADAEAFWFMSLPNEVTKHSVLIKVDSSDLLPTSELNLRAGAALGLKKDRNLNDYYVLGMAEYKGRLLAYSKQYSTLLVIDPTTAEAVDAYEMPAMADAHSMTVKGDTLVMLGRRDGKDMVYELSIPESLR